MESNIIIEEANKFLFLLRRNAYTYENELEKDDAIVAATAAVTALCIALRPETNADQAATDGCGSLGGVL